MFSSRRPVRTFLIAQLVCTFLIATVAALFWGKVGLLNVLLGGGVAFLNAAGTAFAWPRLLEKKDIALALSIIVSKFALSIGIFYWLATGSGAQAALLLFALGLASVVPAAITVAAIDFFVNSSSKEDLET